MREPRRAITALTGAAFARTPRFVTTRVLLAHQAKPRRFFVREGCCSLLEVVQATDFTSVRYFSRRCREKFGQNPPVTLLRDKRNDRPGKLVGNLYTKPPDSDRTGSKPLKLNDSL